MKKPLYVDRMPVTADTLLKTAPCKIPALMPCKGVKQQVKVSSAECEKETGEV